MKKTVIALAAAAATGAFAQVTLSGNLDVAGISVTGTLAGANGTSFSSTTGTSSTSTIKITAVEDLGGGMKATAQYEIDPRSAFNDKFGITHSPDQGSSESTTATVASTLTGFATHEMFVGLSGGFGNVQLGAPNAPSLNINGTSSPLGTGVGSGYTNNGAANTGWISMMQTRYTRSIKYTSPTINGFSLQVAYAPGNDQTANTGYTTALSIQNGRAVTDAALLYSAGNLNLAVANLSQAAQTNATGWYALPSSAGLPHAATSSTAIAANYKFGNVTVYGASMNGNDVVGTTTARTASAMRGAVKVELGNVDLMAQYTEVKSNTTIQKTTGLRADYKFSKTAAAYVAFEQYDSGASSANQMNISAIGLRKSF